MRPQINWSFEMRYFMFVFCVWARAFLRKPRRLKIAHDWYHYLHHYLCSHHATSITTTLPPLALPSFYHNTATKPELLPIPQPLQSTLLHCHYHHHYSVATTATR